MTLTLNGVWRGYRGMFAVALFSIPYGIAFGTAATDAGVMPVEAIAMSAFIFSGVAQFAALEFWREPVPWAMLAFVVTAASARMLVMGAVLAPWINAIPAGRRFLALAWMSDPNFAKSQPEFRAGERDVGTMLGAGLSLWSLWVLGTVIGTLAGNVIGDVAVFGFDVVMVCFFAALVAGEAGKRSPILPIAAAALVAVVTLPWLPSGWNVIAAALTGGVLTVMRRDV
ncbi:AzlC family ABC transporter permease [Hwanghaeella sp.]|uniref:AzlC family ABC transporter permease n=1 Tax=Hwanghaeella sp. TaxID=2605943 RepID=UPI003CCC1A70